MSKIVKLLQNIILFTNQTYNESDSSCDVFSLEKTDFENSMWILGHNEYVLKMAKISFYKKHYVFILPGHFLYVYILRHSYIYTNMNKYVKDIYA